MSVRAKAVTPAAMTGCELAVSVVFLRVNSQREAKRASIPEKPIRLYAVTLCTLSAQTLPRTTILSHFDICAFFSASRAARSLATFSAGVSAGGILFGPGGGFLGALGLEKRWGLVLDLEGVFAEEGAERRKVFE